MKKNVYNIAYSQAVTHPSTNATQCCLTSVIGRELVLSTWYGRRQVSRAPNLSKFLVQQKKKSIKLLNCVITMNKQMTSSTSAQENRFILQITFSRLSLALKKRQTKCLICNRYTPLVEVNSSKYQLGLLDNLKETAIPICRDLANEWLWQ